VDGPDAWPAVTAAALAFRTNPKFHDYLLLPFPLRSDVRIDSSLNKHVWSKGIKSIPTRIRIRLSRRRNDNEDAKEKMYTLVTYVPVASVKGMQTTTVEEE
jgi:hypothetical protein